MVGTRIDVMTGVMVVKESYLRPINVGLRFRFKIRLIHNLSTLNRFANLSDKSTLQKRFP